MNKKIVFIILVIIVLLSAGFLRLYNLNFTEFKVDQALNMYLTLDIIKNGPIPERVLLSSIKTYNPPLFHYLLIIPILVSKNPIVASGFIATLNILAILGAFFLIKSIFNKRIALITCALWAVNPWSVMYARHIWHQNLLPIFIILFFGATLKLVLDARQDKPQSIHISLAILALACLLQLHLSTIALIPILIFVMIWRRKQFFLKHLLLGILVFIILCLPYFIYEIQHNFYNFNTMLEVSKLPNQQHWSALLAPFKLATTRGLDKYLGSHLPNLLASTTWGNIINWLQMLILLVGIIYIIQRIINQIIKSRQPASGSIQNRSCLDLENKQYLVIILWLVLPVIFLFFNKSIIHDHYFILLFPVQFIISAIILDKIFKLTFKKIAITRTIKIVSGLILTAIFIYPGLYSLSWLKMTKARQCLDGIYGKPYKYQENSVRDLLKNGEKNLRIIYNQTCDCPYCFPVHIQYIYDYLTHKL